MRMTDKESIEKEKSTHDNKNEQEKQEKELFFDLLAELRL